MQTSYPRKMLMGPLAARRTITKERTVEPQMFVDVEHEEVLDSDNHDDEFLSRFSRLSTAAATAATALTVASTDVMARTDLGTMTPQEFQPVCPTSDIIYRLLQSSVLSLVGKDNFIEYAPLISGGLLRIRLEICVVESFFEEAIGPFIDKNGFSWILPVHETVETFLAGTIFAAATSFILIGSTKIVSVIATYVDFLIGLPTRTLGGFVYDRASGKPVTLDIGIGKFKTRVIGPPKEEEENFTKGDLNPLKVLILIVSAVTKFFGQVVGVSYACCYCSWTNTGTVSPSITFCFLSLACVATGGPTNHLRSGYICREISLPMGNGLHFVQVCSLQGISRLSLISIFIFRVASSLSFLAIIYIYTYSSNSIRMIPYLEVITQVIYVVRFTGVFLLVEISCNKGDVSLSSKRIGLESSRGVPS